ncbi:fanconi anemia group I protein [Caerostris extrusa]|uniref:Fanconi anemia group I protein n=1 Tax=Caerostris extrusa TaxID=172846 RepID=A0AAV4YB85_CAEEX|nr:fanconi anemia group I protein [Caerostris extrusa]
MLVLRKALFHRDIEARKVAVSGYLMILKKLNFIGKVSLSQSQTSISSQASSASLIIKADVYTNAGNPSSKTMCLEIMGLLKRVLMQQGAVKQLLYVGLYDAILQNRSLRDIVLELLLGQFEKLYDSSDDSDLPLRFNLCFQELKGNIVMDEPLADLITSICLILLESESIVDEDEYDLSAQKMLEDFLQS